MAEPAQEQVKGWKDRIAAVRMLQDKGDWCSAAFFADEFDSLLTAYEERGLENERLRADLEVAESRKSGAFRDLRQQLEAAQGQNAEMRAALLAVDALVKAGVQS